MPENPESEGSRLITLKQIELEHGVSRSALHTYRLSSTFPQPVPVEGSTKTLFQADEVAAWFQANPKQQGKKRDRFLSQPQGESVTTTVDPRLALMSRLNTPPYDEAAGKTGTPLGEAAQLLDAYRAAILREAADSVSDMPAPDCSDFSDLDEAWESGASAAARRLRDVADEWPEPQDG
ncbi:helix-turn-helix transcriptional regulator [Streptomyces adelaidensis]|uniref:helix-turn-helix transcriptional regulator n=1 Tax=Streptomyces adelaidensis TaxID=2796465 RepID=UPI001906BABD|nr:DNA-binding protein [Streptomyces adelaidensis]